MSENKQDKDSQEKKHFSSERNIGGRSFEMDLLVLSNGCFLNISEGKPPRMGVITVAIKTGERFTSSSLIPESKGSIFAGMIGEMLADRLHGIAVISLHLREELDTTSMKTLINEVRNLLNRD
jgi:hypothetical protein